MRFGSRYFRSPLRTDILLRRFSSKRLTSRWQIVMGGTAASGYGL